MENQWESNAEEMENYFRHLLSLNLEEDEVCDQQENNFSHNSSPMEAETKELQNSNMVTLAIYMCVCICITYINIY